MDWKRKLTSRKFWAAIASFVSMLIIALRGDASEAETVTGLIMAGAAVIAYIVGEGLTDAAGAGGGAAETVRRTVCPAGRKPGCCRDRKSAAADFADGWAGRICAGLRARKSGLRGLAQAGTDFL